MLCPAMYAGPARGADIYKYRDERGAVHFIDDPERVPARYRKSLEKVKSEVTVVERPGDKSWGKEGLPVLERFDFKSALSEPDADGPASAFGVVLGELWNSSLGFSVLFAAALLALLAAGVFMARDVTVKHRRKRYMTLLPLACVSALVFLWLSLAGAQAKRFVRDCEARSNQSLALKGADPARQRRLVSLRDACSRWEERLEKLARDGGERY
jgi:hypothetical protein